MATYCRHKSYFTGPLKENRSSKFEPAGAGIFLRTHNCSNKNPTATYSSKKLVPAITAESYLHRFANDYRAARGAQDQGWLRIEKQMGNSHSRKKNGKLPSRKEKKKSASTRGEHQTQRTGTAATATATVSSASKSKAATTTHVVQENPAANMSSISKPADNDVVMAESAGNNGAIVLDMLSDVRTRYHVNPKEIGHGHYGVVRKCMDRETKVWYAIKSIRKSKVGD